MGGRHSRTKGHSFERHIAKLFRELGLFPFAKRHLENQKEEALGFDLDNTGPFLFQLKRYAKWVSVSKIFEVQKQYEGDIPVLVQKADNQPAISSLFFDDFCRVIEGFLLYQKHKTLIDELENKSEEDKHKEDKHGEAQ